MKENDKNIMEVGSTFVLYKGQWSAIELLNMEERGILLTALYKELFGVGKFDEEYPSNVKVALGFISIQISIDKRKWEQKCEQNRQRAIKRWEKYKNAKNTTACLAMHNENENENENENDTNSSVVSEKKEGSIAAKEISGKSANFDTAAAWQQNFIKTFNELIAGSNIPPVRRLSAKRMDKLRVIWREFSTKDLAEVVRKAAASDFLNGRGTKHYFQATFDWLIEPENFLKVLEGTYR